MKRRKTLLAALLALLLAVPALAVFNEKDLGETLNVLRFELNQEVSKLSTRQSRINTSNKSQHLQMVDILKKCNELALMLYSQNQDYTFDLTYALEEVTREYEEFNKSRLPFDDIITRLDLEIDRYSRLVESLRRLPPELKTVEDLPDSLTYHNDSIKSLSVPRPRDLAGDEARSEVRGTAAAVSERTRTIIDSLNAQGHMHAFFLDAKGQENRDSCIYYATTLLKMFQASKDRIVADNEHYDDASARLKESYDYAHNRYEMLQKSVFLNSSENYFRVLGHLPSYAAQAFYDAQMKYSRKISSDVRLSHSEWRGPVVSGFMVIVLMALLVSTLLAVILVKVLSRFVKLFQTEEFQKRKRCFNQLLGVGIFSLVVWIIAMTTENHFFEMASRLLLVLSWLLAAILLSMLIRLSPKKLDPGMKLYMPVILVGIMVVTLRILFLPNRMMNLFFPPLLLVIFVWQLAVCRKYSGKADKADSIISWLSLFIVAVSTVMSWTGYLFLGLLVMIAWLFQVAAIETITAATVLLDYYFQKRLGVRIDKAQIDVKLSGAKAAKGDFIFVTWLYDLIKSAALPVIAVLSLPFCINLALNVFDLTEISHNIFYKPIFDVQNAEGEVILHLTFRKIILVTCLFFVFRYACYAIRAFYKVIMTERLKLKSGRSHIHTNEINLTLANNLIGILVWGIYIVACILIMKIPMGAISIVAAGLATGLGLAMKDILNNFIYGIQLMSGRLRVGDWVECDGIRGKCTAISYQSTQIETLDGAVMSFLNTSLFNKNFKNLTRNNSYEFVKIGVGVGYGVDVEKVRTMLLEALKVLQTKDSYGRDIVDTKKGLSVALDEFGDSSVDLAVKQFVLVAERSAYIAKAKEIIYNTLNENNIAIPFPQRDIHVINN